MRSRIAVLLLFLVVAVAAHAQSARPAEETVDSNDTTQTTTTSTTSTTTTTTTVATQQPPAGPPWIHLVRIAALAGPVAFLLIAWLTGVILHYRIVRREQAQFPVVRGTRAPQTMPMIVSALLFLLPVALFVFFEVRSRIEIAKNIGGVVDEWQPVTARAWIALLVCLVLAVMPWLFARRADTVA
jgi:hypothetical protein